MDMISLTPEHKAEDQKWIKHFEDKYQFKFFEPTFKEVPFASQFFYDKRFSERISSLEHYLLGTYPINMGTNIHEEMRELKQLFSKEEYQWHQMHNKLGRNCWRTQAGMGLRLLNSILNRTDLHVATAIPAPHEYSRMLFKQKVDFCTSVDKELYSILEKLYEGQTQFQLVQ